MTQQYLVSSSYWDDTLTPEAVFATRRAATDAIKAATRRAGFEQLNLIEMTKDNLTTNASNEAKSPAFLVGAVMRSASELEMRLEELQLDFDECKKWYDSAYKKYKDDRKYWGKGEADPNEYLEASRQLELIKLQIKTIKWCLGGHLV